ncbi:CPXCG motif-containing cysteine-rich protein [Thalassotalea ponticola]|uniref:CPXCG motif-containing cysteine-rich protein n=1 Tax=Thalassotalea ponticola TaxID=1523392 RepID=UPI0025B4930D|nr:CPXCG motif-containing cysteine-rich protein [Thalassotalea ponticola]MDN3651230.1 CPXCG motif-containing cysteine-rich protein [Thalassotalea ponticola]
MAQNMSKKTIHCPHCAHPMHIELDTSQGDQNYYETCPNCCCEMHLNMHIDDYNQVIQLAIDADDEQVF